MLALAYVYFNYIKSHMNVWATCAPSTADRTRRGTLERSTTLPNKRISIKLLTFCSRMIFNCSVCQQRNRSSGRTGVSPKIKTKQMHLNRSIWTLLSLTFSRVSHVSIRYLLHFLCGARAHVWNSFSLPESSAWCISSGVSVCVTVECSTPQFERYRL